MLSSLRPAKSYKLKDEALWGSFRTFRVSRSMHSPQELRLRTDSAASKTVDTYNLVSSQAPTASGAAARPCLLPLTRSAPISTVDSDSASRRERVLTFLHCTAAPVQWALYRKGVEPCFKGRTCFDAQRRKSAQNKYKDLQMHHQLAASSLRSGLARRVPEETGIC